MTGDDTGLPDQLATRDASGDPLGSIRSLATDNEARVGRLRSAQIPQHVGMAAACRALAIELPRVIIAQVDADLKDGVLAQRWEAARTAASEPSASGDVDSTLAALALLLREQGRAVMRHLVRREKEWAADAYRLEGQADALEAQAHQLRQVVGMAATADAGYTASDTPAVARGEAAVVTDAP